MILAAAVSDFYVAELAEHKIQSRSTGGGLSLALAATPKCADGAESKSFGLGVATAFKTTS